MFPAENLLTLINGLGGIVWEADPDTFQFSFVSQQAETILGHPVARWLEPEFWKRHTHPADVERCTAFCLAASRQGRDHTFEYRMIAADGRIVWLRDIVSVRTTPQGGRRLIGIALDITGDKREEAGKNRLSRLYEALLENASDNISLVRADGSTVYQSSSVRRQLGYDPDDLVARNNFDLVHPHDIELVRDGFAAVLQSDVPIGPLRFRARHKDGRWCLLETIGRRIRDEDGAMLAVLSTRDVSSVLATQRALEEAQDQLAHAVKMEAVGRLAGGIAHDFNNLLTVVAGYADLLGTTIEPDDPRGRDIDEIKRAAQRASLLTRQLLTFSRKQVVRPEALDLNHVVRDVAGLVQRLVGEDVELAVETTPASLLVWADRAQLEQVLMNLAVNARDAMSPGGRLSVATTLGDGLAVLTVSDTGAGIPPAAVDHIFEPFFTTKETGKGTGLGLSSVYGIIKQAGGDIRVSSEVNAGTTFTISLPLADGRGPAETAGGETVAGGTETSMC